MALSRLVALACGALPFITWALFYQAIRPQMAMQWTFSGTPTWTLSKTAFGVCMLVFLCLVALLVFAPSGILLRGSGKSALSYNLMDVLIAVIVASCQSLVILLICG